MSNDENCQSCIYRQACGPAITIQRREEACRNYEPDLVHARAVLASAERDAHPRATLRQLRDLLGVTEPKKGKK